MRIARSIRFVANAARESASGVITATRLPCLLRASTRPARSVHHSGGLRRPSNWPASGGVRLRPPNRESSMTFAQPEAKSALSGAHATVDVAGAVDAVCGDQTAQRAAHGDRVHEVDAGIAVSQTQPTRPYTRRRPHDHRGTCAAAVAPAEVPTTRSAASVISRPASAKPPMVPISHALPAAPSPPRTRATL